MTTEASATQSAEPFAQDRLDAVRHELRMQTIVADTTAPNSELRRVLGVLTELAGADGELPLEDRTEAMARAECDSGDHLPVYAAADDEAIGYGFPCPYCMLADAHEAHRYCEHSRHRAWRRWRLTHWLVTEAYLLGISSSGCGVRFGRGCNRCLIKGIRLRGPRPYVLFVRRSTWRCLLIGRHFPGDPIGFGLCSKCVPCPDCGSRTAEHRPGCDL